MRREATAPLLVLQAGAVLVVLAALPYQWFQLDRYTFVKEAVLLATALAASLLCLASARRLTVLVVDVPVAGYLALSLLSTLLAANGWLAARALGVSLAGVGLFWSARAVARAGHAPRLLAALAASVVLGAATGLIQAYGLVTTDLASATRAPGGTFGNRNFMAHMVALGLPLLVAVTVQARRRAGLCLGTAGIVIAVAALVLSRSRAAWLGAGACLVFLVVEGLWAGRLWDDRQLRRRVTLLAGTALAGLLLALTLPNRLNWRSDSPYLDSLTGVANYREGSGRGRIIQYGNTLSMALDHPVLGVGPGNWPVHYPRYMSPDDPSFDADDVIPTNPWPSSDWVAILAERGMPALLLLVLAGGSIALGAWARIRDGSGRPPSVSDLAIAATLIAIVVVGAFDAVLLLPAPAFFAWTAVGALASTARPIREIPLTSRTRRRLMTVAAVVGGGLLLRALAQVAAMAIATGGGRDDLALAARVDPGSYRIHMALAQEWRAARRCDRARPHAEQARDLFPHHPAPRLVLRACDRRR
ncbi:MAG TPA: O-antigen ligase family protein [Gemmatimonadales bacterium]|nr:O-antigen ligase family protein [Gemmatimonadales bacterium]